MASSAVPLTVVVAAAAIMVVVAIVAVVVIVVLVVFVLLVVVLLDLGIPGKSRNKHRDIYSFCQHRSKVIMLGASM